MTSALPHRLDTDLLPCLATRAPAAAAIRAEPVEMLTEPMLSPPVPAMSSTLPPGLTGTPADRMALARPVISSTLSPCMPGPLQVCMYVREVLCRWLLRLPAGIPWLPGGQERLPWLLCWSHQAVPADAED